MGYLRVRAMVASRDPWASQRLRRLRKARARCTSGDGDSIFVIRIRRIWPGWNLMSAGIVQPASGFVRAIQAHARANIGKCLNAYSKT